MRFLAAAIGLIVLLAAAVGAGSGVGSGGQPVRNRPVTATSARTAGTAAPSATQPALNVATFAIVLKDHTQFVGDLLKLDPVPLQTDFGKVSIPLKLIDGFEPAKTKNALLVHFKNGDTLTARLPLPGLQVRTRYGTVNVPLDELASATAGDKLRVNAPEPVAELPTGVLPDPGRLTAFSASIGKTLYFRVIGALGGSIWGTDFYTADSVLATAAVHAGAVKLGETGIVKVTFVPGLPFHMGAVKNGISSSSYGTYSFSYRIEKMKRPPVAPKRRGRSGRR